MQLTDRDLEAQVDDLLVTLFNSRAGFASWFCGRVGVIKGSSSFLSSAERAQPCGHNVG